METKKDKQGFEKGDKAQVEKVKVTDDGSRDGIQKIVVTRRDPLARWWAGGCTVLTAALMLTDIISNCNLRRQSPITEPELAVYREDLQNELAELRATKLQLEEDVVKTRAAGFFVLQKVLAATKQEPIKYEEYMVAVDNIYQSSKDAARITTPLKK